MPNPAQPAEPAASGLGGGSPRAGLLLGQAVLDLLEQLVAALVRVEPGRSDLLRALALALEVGGLRLARGEEEPDARGARPVADHDLLVALLALEARVDVLGLEAVHHGRADVAVLVRRGVVRAEPAAGEGENGQARGGEHRRGERALHPRGG